MSLATVGNPLGAAVVRAVGEGNGVVGAVQLTKDAMNTKRVIQ